MNKYLIIKPGEAVVFKSKKEIKKLLNKLEMFGFKVGDSLSKGMRPFTHYITSKEKSDSLWWGSINFDVAEKHTVVPAKCIFKRIKKLSVDKPLEERVEVLEKEVFKEDKTIFTRSGWYKNQNHNKSLFYLDVEKRESIGINYKGEYFHLTSVNLRKERTFYLVSEEEALKEITEFFNKKGYRRSSVTEHGFNLLSNKVEFNTELFCFTIGSVVIAQPKQGLTKLKSISIPSKAGTFGVFDKGSINELESINYCNIQRKFWYKSVNGSVSYQFKPVSPTLQLELETFYKTLENEKQ